MTGQKTHIVMRVFMTELQIYEWDGVAYDSALPFQKLMSAL